jgi:branched-chain amino acid transport system substrate-binding protein
MNKTRFAALAAAVCLTASAVQAADPLPIEVILPLTGNAAFVGQGQYKTLQVLEAQVNKDGGIAGRPLKFNFHDDQSSPQQTVQITQSITPDKPSVMIGSSIVAMCNAAAPLLRQGPVDYCLSPGVHPADGSYVFSSSISTTGLIETAVRYFRLRGWTHLATITSSDSSGQDADNGIAEILKLPENKDIQIVEKQHFNLGDVSIAAQVERISQSKPQAIIAWTTGAPVATIFKGLIQAGIDLPITTTNGNQTNAEMTQFADFLPKQLFIPSSAFPKHAGLYKLDPKVEAEQAKFFAAADAAKLDIDNMSALAWDPGLLIVSLLRKLGPTATAAQFRTAIADTTDFAGINGIYNFKKIPQRGIDSTEALMTTWNATTKQWVPVSELGGKPLADK